MFEDKKLSAKVQVRLKKVSWRVNKLQREMALQQRVFELEKKFQFIEVENKRLWKFVTTNN